MMIGRYKTVSHLGRGGMADVYLCQLAGIGGFDKSVVVKRLLPEHAADPQFLQMFLDEARLAARLSHTNIAQVYELGEVDGTPFIAMEYVDGPTFRQVIRESRKAKKVHAGHLARVAAGVALGLDHAHNAKGPDGQPLNIVHRDVTPHNVIVSMDGVPKLLDFGVAKAATRMQQTETGSLKGKLPYLAPEQIQGGGDARSDLFSLGVSLYFATTGVMPFRGENDLALLGAISRGQFAPPSAVVPGYPAKLEQIVVWAMQADPARRCPTARMLHNALDGFASSGDHLSTQDALVAWLQELFPDPKSYAEGRKAHQTNQGTGSSRVLEAPIGGFGLSAAGVTLGTRVTTPRARIWLMVGLALAVSLGALGTTAAFVLDRNRSAPPQTPAVQTVESIKGYLDEAERLAAEGKARVAQDLLAQARRVQRVSQADAIRLSRLTHKVEGEILRASARRALAMGSYAEAREYCIKALDLDIADEEAGALLLATEEAAAQHKEEKLSEAAARRARAAVEAARAQAVQRAADRARAAADADAGGWGIDLSPPPSLSGTR